MRIRSFIQTFWTLNLTHSWLVRPDLFALKSLVKPCRVSRLVSAHCFSEVSREWWTRKLLDFFSPFSGFSVALSALSKIGNKMFQKSWRQVSWSRLDPWAEMVPKRVWPADLRTEGRWSTHKTAIALYKDNQSFWTSDWSTSSANSWHKKSTIFQSSPNQGSNFN